jgi:putative hemolysin
VPMQEISDGATPDRPGSQVRAVRDFVMKRHAARPEHTVRPYRPVVVDGMGLDDIEPPARVRMPPLMRGYLRLGAKILGEPAHDPDFGVADFMALLSREETDTRYLKRLGSVGSAAQAVGQE